MGQSGTSTKKSNYSKAHPVGVRRLEMFVPLWLWHKNRHSKNLALRIALKLAGGPLQIFNIAKGSSGY
jgi:hypothetical protein